jgi:hypothetical protein
MNDQIKIGNNLKALLRQTKSWHSACRWLLFHVGSSDRLRDEGGIAG